jgi:hypothetical protein
MPPKKRKRVDPPLETTYHSIDAHDQNLYNTADNPTRLAIIALRAKIQKDTPEDCKPHQYAPPWGGRN